MAATIDPKLKTLMLTLPGHYVIGITGGKVINAEVEYVDEGLTIPQYLVLDPDRVTSIVLYDTPDGPESRFRKICPAWLPHFPNTARTLA